MQNAHPSPNHPSNLNCRKVKARMFTMNPCVFNSGLNHWMLLILLVCKHCFFITIAGAHFSQCNPMMNSLTSVNPTVHIMLMNIILEAIFIPEGGWTLIVWIEQSRPNTLHYDIILAENPLPDVCIKYEKLSRDFGEKKRMQIKSSKALTQGPQSLRVSLSRISSLYYSTRKWWWWTLGSPQWRTNLTFWTAPDATRHTHGHRRYMYTSNLLMFTGNFMHCHFQPLQQRDWRTWIAQLPTH